MRKGRHKTTYKPNHELSRFALICDKQTKLSECTGWPMCQTTYCSRKQTELSKCTRWPMCQTTICNAFISYLVKPFTFTYVPRTITGDVNCGIHSYSLKDIYPRLALLLLFFFLYALVYLAFIFRLLIPKSRHQRLTASLMNTFLPLYYNQLWTSLPNASQLYQ